MDSITIAMNFFQWMKEKNWGGWGTGSKKKIMGDLKRKRKIVLQKNFFGGGSKHFFLLGVQIFT